MKIILKLVLAFALILLWAGPAAAIDKTKKDENPKKDQVQVDKAQKPPEQEKQQKETIGGSENTKKSYDNFIDTNNNGIDDRAESKNAPPKPQKDESSKKPEKK